MASQRQLRVGEMVRHSLSRMLQQGDVSWPEGVSETPVTISEVRISPDLRAALVFVMPLGGEKVKETVRALNDMAPACRHILASEIELRYVPTLKFKADDSYGQADVVERLLRDPHVARDLEPSADPDKE
ncbi:MAG: 30S ribosome-binding factor RbfA [Alphaproteobacteria bacterium]|nr:MAG: 30S ribosome-binding factor RbfA [Alphaproteobacteria bacterium]